MVLAQTFANVANQNSTRPVISFRGRETNYRDFRSQVARLSYLYQHELGHGARVAFLCSNSPAFLSTFLALTNTRSITIPIPPELPPSEIGAWLKETKATHLAATNDFVGRAREILQAEKFNIPIIEIERKQGGEYDTTYSPPSENQPLETDVILFLRTAGTTGKPKYVSFTHKQLQHAAVSLKTLYKASAVDRFHTQMSWAHPFAFAHAMLFPALLGAAIVVDLGMDGAELVTFVQESKANRLIGTPQWYLKLLLACRNAKQGIPGVKSVTVGVGNLPTEIRKAFDLLKISVSQCYGQTENLWTIAMEEMTEPGSAHTKERGFVGRGLAGLKYRVMDPAGDEKPGRGPRSGQLAVMGPTVMSSYLDSEKTKAALRGTWLHTGDIVKLDGDGEDLKMVYLGRKEDLLFDQGEYISLAKMDAALRKLPGVADAAGFMAYNSKNEPALLCAIVKTPGANLNEKAVIDHCVANLTPQLTPKLVFFTDHIPRDAGNAVNAFRLRTQFAGTLG